MVGAAVTTVFYPPATGFFQLPNSPVEYESPCGCRYFLNGTILGVCPGHRPFAESALTAADVLEAMEG